jgi:succinoglycan biosynthesis transport protein ExoP
MNATAFDWVPDLLFFLRRSWRTVLIGAVAAVALGVLYLLVARPSYTASSVVMIDVRANASFQPRTDVIDSQYANGITESQVEVLQSLGVARAVVRTLGLQDDPAFLGNGGSVVGTLLGLLTRPFSHGPPATVDSRQTAAAEMLEGMIRVRRIGMSFVLALDVTTNDAALSARLNNALVDAFVESGLDAKSVNTKRASAWLEQRIAELQAQATAADRAVQDFKAQAGIVDTDKGLMDEQHLGELTSQLVLARARVADAIGKRDRVHEIIAATQAPGAAPGQGVSDELQNPVIVHLREQYVDLANQAAQLAAKVGPNHDSVQLLRGRLADLRLQIRSELDRIAQGAESDYQVALSSRDDIQRQLDTLVAADQRTNVNMVRLRALQSAADTYKALYADFLQRYTEAVQNQSFPISDVRVVTRAATPLSQSWPRVTLVLGGALVAGIGLGLAAALIRASLDRGIRSAAQVRAGLGLPCLGILPALRRPALLAPALRPNAAAARAAADSRTIAAPGLWRQVMLKPFSPYAEAIRGLRFKLARERRAPEALREARVSGVEGTRDGGVIGCVSALPGEGKTTVCANFAFFLAGAGFRTLLVDWDLRRQSLSHALSPGRRSGFADVAAGRAALDDALWRDPATGLEFLPAAAFSGAGAAAPMPGPDAILSGFGDLLATLRQRFDYIVVDLPAMLAVVDAAVAARLVDGVVIVVEWGKTSLAVVQDSIAQSQIDPDRLLGVLLNKADLDSVTYYDPPIPTPAQAAPGGPRVPA